ncbi:MAG: DMT family transporter [Caldisericia bacterium]|nr:DMT family transporter [Caldisericia bacterium]
MRLIVLKSARFAYGYTLLAVACWSTVGTAFKLTLSHISPYQLVCYSTWFSTATLLMISWFTGKFPQLWETIKNSKQRWFILILGFLNPFLYYAILFQAYYILLAQEAMVLNYTWGIGIIILSGLLLKQKIYFYQMIAVIISFIGIVIIATKGSFFQYRPTNLYGILLAIGTAWVWSFYWILNVRQKKDAVVMLTLQWCVGSLLCLFLPWRGSINLPGILGSIYTGLFEMSLPFIAWFMALQAAENAASVTNLVFLSPFTSLIWIHLVVKEPIHPSSWIGLIWIIAGIWLNQPVTLRWQNYILNKVSHS